MADAAPPTQAKPGTACLGCRSRKLKCSRGENGCTNCLKSDLPCVYPTPEIGVKRKRGPYKKDKPPRERHLEDLVKYLEPKSAASHGEKSRALSDSHRQSTALSVDHLCRDSPDRDAESSILSRFRRADGHQSSSSEALVKDALIALTKSSVSEREATSEYARAGFGRRTNEPPPAHGMLGVHPSVSDIFEYWHLYLTRVDPLLKLIHAPTVAKKLCSAIDHLQETDSNFQTLLFGVYYVAVCSCTVQEVRERFGESRSVLLQRYSRAIEANLADNYNMPTLESLQGLLLHLKSVQRSETETNVRALFSLAVRLSQLIGIHQDPGDKFSVFEGEMRRRAWWHVCGMESRGAEEGGTRSTTIMHDQNVRFPGNFNDVDLAPDMKLVPEPRIGSSDMTYPLLRWEMVYLSYRMWSARIQAKKTPHLNAQAEQLRRLEETQINLREKYLQYLHRSRVYDRMSLDFVDTLFIKYRLMVEYPFPHVPSAQMTPERRLNLLESSVKIIHKTHMAASEDWMGSWRWFYRAWIQWHALATVIVELSLSTNQQFANSAWAVLDPILADWDQMYQAKKGEPAWEHVHMIVERARNLRANSWEAETSTRYQTPTSVERYAADGTRPARSPSTLPTPNTWETPPNIALHPSSTSLPPLDPRNVSTGAEHTYVGPPSVPATSLPMMVPPCDIGNWGDDLEGVNFDAFDAVFGDTAWAFPELNMSFNMQSTS